MNNKMLAAALCAWVGLAGMPAVAQAADDATQRWNFDVLLDGKPIGAHRFTLTTQSGTGADAQRTVVSEADFTVKLLGITAYTYHHKATEQWRGNCLVALDATTNDDGKALAAKAQVQGDTLQVSQPRAASASGCVMSYAYWNPALHTQTRLLNAQTGAIDTVQISNAGSGEVDVRGKPAQATRWRITGPEQPVDVWLSAQGAWLGLDSTVKGGRKLTYRLHGEPAAP